TPRTGAAGSAVPPSTFPTRGNSAGARWTCSPRPGWSATAARRPAPGADGRCGRPPPGSPRWRTGTRCEMDPFREERTAAGDARRTPGIRENDADRLNPTWEGDPSGTERSGGRSMSDASTTRHTEARTPTVPPGRPLASRPIPTGRPRPWDTPAEPEAVEDEQVTAPIPVVGGAQDAPGGADPAEQEAERDGEPAEEPAGGGAAPAAPAPAEAAGAEPAALRPEPGTGPAGAATGKDWALPSAPTGPQRPFAPRSAATGPQPGLGDLLGASGAGRGPEGGRPAPPGERGAGPLQAGPADPAADRPTGPQRALGADLLGASGAAGGPDGGRPV